MSTLGYALLSLLTRGPATGYELTARMRTPIGHFWVAKHSQIYPELARLAEAGYVKVREGAGPGPRAKKTYTLTQSGRKALAEWLPEPPTFTPRSEVALKAFAVASAEPGPMAEMYERVAREAVAKVAQFEAELEQLVDDPAHPRFGNYATLRLGVESNRALHTWASWLAGRLRSGA